MTIKSMNLYEEQHEGHERGRVNVSDENVVGDLTSPSFNLVFSRVVSGFHEARMRKNFSLAFFALFCFSTANRNRTKCLGVSHRLHQNFKHVTLDVYKG